METLTRLIPLTQGKFATVDAIDYDFLIQWNWCAQRKDTKQGPRWFAKRGTEIGGIQRTILMHREIAKRMGLPESPEYDHKDLNSINNTRKNIRPASHGQNTANAAKRPNCSSQFKGVHWHRQISRWVAQIKHDGKRVHLGTFLSEVEAHAAYAHAAKQAFGEFARV